MSIKCLSFGAPTLTDQYPFDAQKRKTGMLPMPCHTPRAGHGNGVSLQMLGYFSELV
ncbi:hypothetical protein E5S67_00315 [Microcoleus sp. IPMA8]|uniref:Uncharacterized protein n=1 Tax=Microcoleus asticus IPMA8 TaxID=2563858 RepID=A0ABX2CQD9_9CYAN|nr:hypothetical protein [Microcoleus asticus IPMA8]